MRKKLINALDINQGNRILIIACGTGQSFELIEEKIGNKGEIIAVDYSAGMLNKAKKRIDKNEWSNIKLIEADAREINKKFFQRNNIQCNFDFVIGELAFSVIPEWKKVMKTSISLLNETGKIGLLDWFRPEKDLLTKITNLLAEAETTRNTIDYAEHLTANFKIIKKYFFKSIYVAVGNKKTAQ